MRQSLPAVTFFCFYLLLTITAKPQSTTTFSNTTAITITDGPVAPAPASPYPSTITISGLTGTVTNVTLTISGFTHPRPADVDMLLVGPGGHTFVFCSDVGGSLASNAVSNLTITFSDAGASQLPTSPSNPVTGTFKPTNYGAIEDIFPSPAPASPYNSAGPFGASIFSVFNNTSPNGTWSLYVVDDALGGVTGSISG